MWFQRLRDHAVELGDLLVDQLQSLQLQRKQLPVHRLRAAGQGIDKLLLATPQTLFSQSRQFLRVALPAGQGPQNTKPAYAQEISYYTRELDAHLF